MKMKMVKAGFAGAALCLCAAGAARGEAILQVFNQSHNEIAARLPEIAEAGYTALWVPPPTKANGGMSVGYDLNDPFDIGNTDLRGTWSTRYGVEADLHNLIELCHRFGMRVYFDNVMNHRSYDVPGYNETTPTDVYPGMCPEDFHLRTTSDGFYRKWDNVRDWNDEWQVMFLGLSDLLDIAHETPNQNFGAKEGDWHEKPRFVRHPNNPEYYCNDPDGNYIGFGNVTAEMLAEHPEAYEEDVGGYLIRAVRWLVDRTKVDGLRLDAVKHVPWYFFGEANNSTSSGGYVGNVQLQFNLSRGFNDWANHRESVFDSDAPRNDAMLFGEHLGFPPPQGDYVSAGMRLVDDRLRNELNWRFSANELTGFDGDSAGSELGWDHGVMHAQSHDNDFVDRKPLHHAMYFMRRGLGLVYSDGNNHAATLTGSGGAFPRWAQTDFLGQWHQKQIPTLLHAHENFARYEQLPKWSQGNYIAFQRGGGWDNEGRCWASMLFMLNSGWDFCQACKTFGDFPADAYLYDYASDMDSYMPHASTESGWTATPYAYANQLAMGDGESDYYKVQLEPNSYAIWSYKNPDPPALFPSPYPDCFTTRDDRIIAPDSRVITILENGTVVEPVMVTRKDGVDGDPDFNPYGVKDDDPTDYSYTIAIPRVTGGTNVTLAVKADGSAETLLLRLDGGMDFGNGINGYYDEYNDSYDPYKHEKREDWRDNPPGAAHDFYLGFENCDGYFTRRIWPEKFAAADWKRCTLGTGGAATYQATVGGAVECFQPEGEPNADQSTADNKLAWVYHDPAGTTDMDGGAQGAARAAGAAGAEASGAAADKGAAKDGETDTRANWIGKSYVNVDGTWYVGSGRDAGDPDEWWGDGEWFNGKDLGCRTGMALGGQVQTYGESDGEGHPARMNWRMSSFDGPGKSGTAELAWHTYTNNNNYFQSGGTGWAPTALDFGGLAKGATYDLNVSFEAQGEQGWIGEPKGYTARFTYAAQPEAGVAAQFQATADGIVVWAKTPKQDGIVAHLYYTSDGNGDHWPEGGGGVPANPWTKAVAGRWSHTGTEGDTDWWYFVLPAMENGTTLRYKIGAARAQHGGEGSGTPFDTIWPGDADAVRKKMDMMSLWTVPGLNFETQQYHKHNDYNSWTTGFKDGYHLVTARMLLKRDKHPREIANTFRQTFYLDRHVPDGYFLYPGEEKPKFGESEYGMVIKTDNTVDEVWVHIEDGDAANDGIGNGTTTNGIVVWAAATQISPWTKEMAQDTEHTKIWRYAYTRIPSSGTATIRVRLREVSSAPVEAWSTNSPADDDLVALHVKELKKEAVTEAPPELFYIEWPAEDGTMVKSGWDVRVRFSRDMISGVPTESVAGKFRVYVNATSNGSTNKGELYSPSAVNVRAATGNWWDGDPGTMLFTMPNCYNGIDGWLYAVTVEFENTANGKTYSKSAQRLVTHKGPLLPTCIVTTPPETDSDGAAWTISMEDSVEAREGGDRTLRETPIVVLTDADAETLDLNFVWPEGYEAGIHATPGSSPSNDTLRLVSEETAGTHKTWTFAWQATNAGTYRFEANVKAPDAGKYDSLTNGTVRTANVLFEERVRTAATNDLDWDNDGIPNTNETARVALPERPAEYWTQDEIFAHQSSGDNRADPAAPDSDGDGLPDGLEVGCRRPVAGGEGESGTDAGADTNGDGWRNFIWDRDPPFYNSCESNYGKVPGVTSRENGGDRLAIAKGSVTDPRNPDTDGDGLPDGVEDADRNGWIDGDGEPIGSDWDPWWARDWPDGKFGIGETWEETSPSLWDSDGDGLCDGWDEDVDLDGWTKIGLVTTNETGDLMTNWLTGAECAAKGFLAAKWSGSEWSGWGGDEAKRPITTRMFVSNLFGAMGDGDTNVAFNVTDPAGGDGWAQKDGWPRLVFAETDPLNPDSDRDGLPDGWEGQHGLDPLNNGVYDFRRGEWTDDPTHGPRGNPDEDRYRPSGEWVPYDNLAEYDGTTDPRQYDAFETGGSAGDSGEIGAGDVIGSVNGNDYHAEFTWWTLDDLIALDDYNQGGNSSDIYRWGDGHDSSRDMVAFYFRDGGEENGKLYFRVDFDDLLPYAEANSLNVYVAINRGSYGDGIEDLPDDVNCKTAMGWHLVTGVYDSENGCVYIRQGQGQSHESRPTAFHGAYFNSELDSVMWSIDRSALVAAGWNGGSTDNLKFQVYTTRDFTGDDGGSGDKGGLNDFADTIGDDGLCSDYWNDYNWIANNGVYRSCVGRTWGGNVWNNCGRHAKLAMLSHGNQAIEAGNTIQALVNNGKGAGYDRPIQIHNIYTNCPLNLHVTPTLAMALQWAEAGTEKTWFSGPALNAAIRRGVASGALSLLGSTYSDHILRYFADDYNQAADTLARGVLNALYGSGDGADVVSEKVLWSPERVADAATFRKIRDLGYTATVIDQTPHLLEWFGRKDALGTNAYKIQRYWVKDAAPAFEMKAFALSSAADGFRYVNTDGGLASDLRHLFLRRARDGGAAISSIFYRWEDFADSANADAYDRSLRWIANHPWIQVVTLDEALEDEQLNIVDGEHMHCRDLDGSEGMAMQDWVNHACNANYDNWFYGEPTRPLESLAGKRFQIRDGDDLTPLPWGTSSNGILHEAWKAVKGIRNAQVKALAEAALFASGFETAFHDEGNNNLSRWSYGTYMYPATDKADLMGMAWRAQSRTRLAAVFAEVDAWAAAGDGPEAFAKDVDLDGEDEWILRNDSVMAVFEAEGGVMAGAWFKNGTNVWQMVGNFAAQPENGYETLGTGSDATRGAAMKDVWVNGSAQTATRFTASAGDGSLTFKAGGLEKTVCLAGADGEDAAFEVEYTGLDGSRTNYVRNGLSPDLATLMVSGQSRMDEEGDGTTSLTVKTTAGGNGVSATVDVTVGQINAAAGDKPEGSDWNTVDLRNAPHVRWVEVMGEGTIAYKLSFSSTRVKHVGPTVTVPAAGRLRFPVGKTTSYRITAADWLGNDLAVSAGELPSAPYLGGSPAWNAANGVLSWSPKALSTGGRNEDWTGSAAFFATDGDGATATRDVSLVVPCDGDGNGIGDDWEWLLFREDEAYHGEGYNGDWDDDGFSDENEWVAGTDPKDDGEYIAWEKQEVAEGNVTLWFRSVPGAPYQIEATDAHGLAEGGTNWSWVADVVGGAGEMTKWSGQRPGGESRMYRIKVPFRNR